jgi:hypothetical protein
MEQDKRWTGPDAEYIVPLYRLAISKRSNEEIMDWMAINGLRYSNQLVKRTLKMAGREDLIDFVIKEEEINIGDPIKSRMTARVGEVVGIRPDGDTIMVHWESGGRQLLSKESVFKLRSKDICDFKDMSKPTTSDKDEAYAVVEDKLSSKL